VRPYRLCSGFVPRYFVLGELVLGLVMLPDAEPDVPPAALDPMLEPY